MLLALERMGGARATARRSSKETVRFRTVGDATCTGRRALRGRPPSRRSSPRSRPPGPPSGARPGPTTVSPRRPWKTGSARGTSRRWRRARLAAGRRRRARCRHDGPPAVRHDRLGRRRQVHPDRPAALRHPPALRRPARGGQTASRAPRHRRGRPLARHRRPAGRARAGDHHRRGVPLRRHADPQVHHRRLPRSRAVHGQHGDRRLHRRPRARRGRRHAGLREQTRRHTCIAALLGVDQLVVCANKMDLVGWDRSAYHRSSTRWTRWPTGSGSRRAP